MNTKILKYRCALAYRKPRNAEPREKLGEVFVKNTTEKMRLRYRRYAFMEDKKRGRLL